MYSISHWKIYRTPYTDTVNSPACSSWFFINKVWKRNCDSSARGPRYTDLQDGAQDPFIYPSAEHSANFCQAVALFNPPPSLYLPLCEQDLQILRMIQTWNDKVLESCEIYLLSFVFFSMSFCLEYA